MFTIGVAPKIKCVHYLNSKFMDHATANDNENFSDMINNVVGGNCMIQVSMDAPLTNWKFFNPSRPTYFRKLY